VDPPPARLLPPKGFALALGTGLLAVVAVLAPAAKPTAAAVAAPQVPARSEVGAGALDAEEGEAWAAQDEALKVEQIREALGLGPRAATDPHRIAKRLEDPEVLDAVKDAAKRSGDGELVRLATAGSESAEDLAKRLGQGMDAGKRAEEARRRLTALRAGGTRPPVPIARRPFLERYFEERGHGRRDTGAR
jgi:hypothetical protein